MLLFVDKNLCIIVFQHEVVMNKFVVGLNLSLKPAHLHQKLVAIAEPSHGKEELSELWQDLP